MFPILDGFESVEDVEEQFAIGLVPGVLLYAAYSQVDYDGTAVVLYATNRQLFEVQGSHCSCHGLEGQWRPSRVMTEAIAIRRGDYWPNPSPEQLTQISAWCKTHGVQA